MIEGVAMETNKIWIPQEKQIQFMQRPEYECLYGGAAGGGKSDALLAEALRQVSIPHYRAIIFRKTYPQLSELIDRSQDLYSRAFPKAKYNESKHFWLFPSGAKIYFGSMQYTKDRKNYQGKHFDFVAFDELTHFTWDEYSYLFSRNRPSRAGTRVYMRATANPGGIGHGWVKDRFITAADPLTTIWSDLQVIDPSGKVITMNKDRIFVPSTVFDNHELLNNDPNYLASLAMLPEADKNALLYGDWDSFSGQVFTEWKNDSQHYADRKWTHVIDPFLVPDDWTIYRGLDWGYSRPFSVGWFAVDHDNRIYRIKEMYGCTKTPNTGIKWTPQQCAKMIKQVESADPNLTGKTIIGIADPAIFASDDGESIESSFESLGVYFDKGDHERIAGKMQCHYRLAFDENGIPMFYVFKNCPEFIRCIPNLVYDESKIEDINSDMEDHNYDEWRYVCMANPMNPAKNYAKQKVIGTDGITDPLNMNQPVKYGRYDYITRL